MITNHLLPVILLVLLSTTAGSAEELVIFHAGSLTVPLHELSNVFRKHNPNIHVRLEGAGSRMCARKIIDLGKRCDIFASADYTVIDDLLMPQWAKWSILFAGNEMVIAYTDQSARAQELDSRNWPQILLDPHVYFARSNPQLDPCGYRTLMVIRLAEKFYGIEKLSQKLEAKDRRWIRPKETDLLPLLQSGSIDYLFIYRSLAVQHKLKFLTLPPAINLGSLQHAGHYRTVSVRLSGKQPGSFINKHARPMRYAVTIPACVRNRTAAIKFIRMLIDPEIGGRILRRCGQPPIIPALARGSTDVPGELQPFIRHNQEAKNSTQ